MFHQQFSLTAKENQSVKEMVLFVSRVNIRFWHEEPLANRAPLNDLYYYLRSSESIQIWVIWQRLPWLHSVGISGTSRKFWSAFRCLMTWLEWMWNHRWWQASAFHNPPILWNALTVLLSPSALLALPFASQRGLLSSLTFCNWTKKRRRKASFQRTLKNDVMILPTRTSGWQHQPWQLWMTLQREPLLWCSSTVCHWQRMKSKSSSFVSWITTGRLIGPALRPHWWRWQRTVHNRYQCIQIKI